MCKQAGGCKTTEVKTEDLGGSAQGAMLLCPAWWVGLDRSTVVTAHEKRLFVPAPFVGFCRAIPLRNGEWVLGQLVSSMV